MARLRRKTSTEVGVVVYCWIVIIARHRAGSESCVDFFGDDCKRLNCTQNGILDGCAKTCNSCTEKGCKIGDYETVEGRCDSCDKPPPLTSQDIDSYNSSCVCPDGKWGVDCNETCSIGCKSTCNRRTGGCHSGCRHCYWGRDCNEIHQNCMCASSGVCKCKQGYLGPTCDVRCPETCLNVECNDTRACTRGCKDGWHGLQCGSPCGGTCESGTCIQDTGHCDKGCIPGWYGARCERRCPRNCASESCDRTDGLCSSCKNGFSGFNCSTPCPPNCATNSCTQSNGSCDKCATGYSGSHCNTTCPGNCATESCEQYGSSCRGCKPGYRGPHCDIRCPGTCSRCHQEGITCTSCNVNWYGSTCDRSCDTCLNGTCDITDGSCLLGCKTGTYGDRCKGTCNANCFKTNCFRDSGNCTHGCKDGWWGPQCDSRCPSHCARCDRVDAGCLGCEESYFGDNCSSRCSSRCGRCDSTGHCLTCAEGWEGDHCHESKSVSPSTVILTCVVLVLLLIIVAMALKSLSKRGSAVYLTPRVEEDIASPANDLELLEVVEARGSAGSQYERIPDTAVSVEDRGYEQLRQAPPCTGYTSLNTAGED